MKKTLFYIILVLIVLSCKSKKEIVQVVPQIKAPTFPKEGINHFIDSTLQVSTDSNFIQLYRYSNNQFIWKNDSSVEHALKWISEARYHGLNAQEYQLDSLHNIWNKLELSDSNFIVNRASFDYSLTTAVQSLGRDIRYGKLNAEAYYKSWNFNKPESYSDSTWIDLVVNNKTSELNLFFSPKHKLYHHIYAELKDLLNQPEGETIQIVDPKFTLRQGDSNRYVLPIKQRLLNIDTSKYLMAFDAELHNAVVLFQQKHGLTADGIIGKNTYYYLNWDKQKHIEILLANQEKLRWIPAQQLDDGVVVNIPSMQLNIYRADSLFSTRRVVVGKYNNQTPILRSRLSYIVFNPCWTVPYSIASKSMLPRLKKDSLYLQKHNMFISQGGKEVMADSVDFNQYNSTNFPFTIFQRTDVNNALGAVKFMFHNNYSVYLHDTPSKRLFSRDIRAFSHGCVRVQNAKQMAEELLFDIDGQTVPHSYYYKKGFPVKVHLKNRLMLNLVYFTCWYDESDKQLKYYKDIYGKDYKIIRDLNLDF
ncbi:L,D-transpeptidase family protein [Saccharicrinis aurantiacus]|uniref:L,D-transpeptidase family protein n=1 Tax=Saccharicrinis aurantiacus TaxID=1849719 RepID=UPI0009FB14CB|nr:L,D-transpeptidase family protein [Saccharicrinis aurantiacus]